MYNEDSDHYGILYDKNKIDPNTTYSWDGSEYGVGNSDLVKHPEDW